MSERERTMAELKAELDADLEVSADAEPVELPRTARPRERDDELLDDPPAGDHHLGRFAGWRATRQLRWIVGGSLGVVGVIGAVIFIQHTREMRDARLHPLPGRRLRHHAGGDFSRHGRSPGDVDRPGAGRDRSRSQTAV